jgi:AraC family transcriptional regulator
VQANLRVERRTTSPGVVELLAGDVHQIRVHAGPPARGMCAHHEFRYTRGDIDVLPAGFADTWDELDATASLVIELSPVVVRRAAEELGRDPDRAGVPLRHQFRDPQIEHLAWALEAHDRAGRPSGLLYEESLMFALAVHLIGGDAPAERAPRGLARPQLDRLLEFIDAHLDENLSLDRLAAVAAVSASHLKTLFKRSTGMPVHAFVMQRRVERARALLRRGDLPASQVALEAGFAHQSHMARCMRRLLGVTPTAFARR